MKLLLDTHVLLWAAGAAGRLPDEARTLLEDPETQPVVSVASLWEVAIKSSIGRPDFQCDPHLLRRGLLENGYAELAVNGTHAVALALLPQLHKDPFDRLLIAQAQVEGITLLTADEVVGRYPGPIRLL